MSDVQRGALSLPWDLETLDQSTSGPYLAHDKSNRAWQNGRLSVPPLLALTNNWRVGVTDIMCVSVVACVVRDLRCARTLTSTIHVTRRFMHVSPKNPT